MKTHKVRPVLVESKEPVVIGSIMKYIKLFPLHDDNIDKSVGSLVLNKNTSVTKSNDYWQHQELILISLEDEKIQVGDTVLEFQKGDLSGEIHTIKNEYFIAPDIQKKVIARQSQIPPEYNPKFIEEYNNGCVEDLEIEMEYRFEEDTSKSYIQGKGQPAIKIVEPKLTNGFVTIIEKEPITYTEEEVKQLILNFAKEASYSNEELIWHYDGDFRDAKEWFENNKKK